MSKILIIYCSRPQTQNTYKIVQGMVKDLQVDITTLDDVNNYDIEKYDLVGFGSGIFFWKFDKRLREYVISLKPYEQKCFIFYTSGMRECKGASTQLVQLLLEKQRNCIGVWHCLGRDVAFTLFKKNGGFNRDHPNANDCADANQFLKTLIN